jgi:GDP-L-fucose synthase
LQAGPAKQRYQCFAGLGLGKSDRDFIHIADCVAGVIATMDKIDDGDAFNLSTGIYTSFIDFARMAAEVCGYCPVVSGMSDKPTGVHARGGDTKKQIAFDFNHSINFRTGIERALAYYDSHVL